MNKSFLDWNYSKEQFVENSTQKTEELGFCKYGV